MNPLAFLLSDSEEEGEVSLVRVEDKGSKSQLALVKIAGVPAMVSWILEPTSPSWDPSCLRRWHLWPS